MGQTCNRAGVFDLGWAYLPSDWSNTHMMKIDIGNLHVVDYYLHKASLCAEAPSWNYWHSRAERYDFDIETEQREGWAYDD